MQTPPRKGFWLSRRSRDLTPGLCSILAEEAIAEWKLSGANLSAAILRSKRFLWAIR